ncbi:uncharacterized protein LOC143378531 [Andrena cerasifolii]|uniref:uncharacterized protein LOC143378531 n=1 Tax=Andrena cerasifolii TaxID=2819439 RepID=UPI004037DDFE
MPNRYCVLCGNRDKSDSYYSFPINEESRKKWLAYCGIDEQVLNTVTKLCWNHFQKDDIIRIGKSTIVKRNAVPSIIRKKRKLHKCSDLIKNCKDCILKKQEGSTVKTADDINCNTVNIDNANLGDGVIDDGRVTDKTVHNGAVNDISSNNTDIKNANFDNRTVNLGNFEFVSVSEDPTVLLEETSGPVNCLSTPQNYESIQCFQTPVKAIRNLRYVGDITPAHLATPRKAEKALQLAKQTIANQHRKIKSLQQARNRLIGRLMTMKALVKYFKKKNRMMEMTAKNLMVTLPSVMKESCKRKIERGK